MRCRGAITGARKTDPEMEEYRREKELEKLMRAPGQPRGEYLMERRTPTFTRRGIRPKWRDLEADE